MLYANYIFLIASMPTSLIRRIIIFQKTQINLSHKEIHVKKKYFFFNTPTNSTQALVKNCCVCQLQI